MKVAGQPRTSDTSSSGGKLLCLGVIFTVNGCARLHSAWAEDRELLGSNPSGGWRGYPDRMTLVVPPNGPWPDVLGTQAERADRQQVRDDQGETSGRHALSPSTFSGCRWIASGRQGAVAPTAYKLSGTLDKRHDVLRGSLRVAAELTEPGNVRGRNNAPPTCYGLSNTRRVVRGSLPGESSETLKVIRHVPLGASWSVCQ